jgi:hypothetical protein
MFVTVQGSPYTRLRRALDHANVTEALSAAGELQHVGLAEALELCLLLCDRDPARFTRAAVRWHGRYCREVDAGLEDGPGRPSGSRSPQEPATGASCSRAR